MSDSVTKYVCSSYLKFFILGSSLFLFSEPLLASTFRHKSHSLSSCDTLAQLISHQYLNNLEGNFRYLENVLCRKDEQSDCEDYNESLSSEGTIIFYPSEEFSNLCVTKALT